MEHFFVFFIFNSIIVFNHNISLNKIALFPQNLWNNSITTTARSFILFYFSFYILNTLLMIFHTKQFVRPINYFNNYLYNDSSHICIKATCIHNNNNNADGKLVRAYLKFLPYSVMSLIYTIPTMSRHVDCEETHNRRAHSPRCFAFYCTNTRR